jgi:hypothetical protein
MQESYRKGLASHPGPESCVGGRKSAGEALTGAHAGQPLSCEIKYSGVPTPSSERKATPQVALWQAADGPHAVGDPAHAWKLLAREPGDPTSTRGGWCNGSAGEGP